MPTGIIYKLSCDEYDKVYIGSSVKTIEQRMSVHKDHFNKWMSKAGTRYCSSFEILKYPNVKIEVLEEIDYIDAHDTLLKQEEQKWIDTTLNCCNLLRAFTPLDIKRQIRNETHKLWREANPEKFKATQKKYQQTHKNEKNEYRRKYSKENRDKMNAYKQKYRNKEIDTDNQKFKNKTLFFVSIQ